MNIVTFNTVKECENTLKEAAIEKSLDNRNILLLDGKYIGSKENVKKDIERFINSLNIENAESDFVIFGLGSGEHIIELINMGLNKIRILVIEPRVDVVSSFLNTSYADKIINDDRVFLYLYNEEDLSGVLNLFLDEFNIANTKCSVFANYSDIYYKEIANLYSNYLEIQNSVLVNMGTHMVHSKHFFNSYMNNLKSIQNSTMINYFKNIYEGMPAVVVSAGPSLSKNVDLLKEFQDEFIIITGGRTLEILTDKGIIPDFVCVIDPDEPAFEIMKNAMDSKVPLVYSEFTNYKVVEEYKGHKIFFTDIGAENASRDFFEKDIDNLYEGGSVAHVCTSLAEYIGCNTIIFIGQDFAYTNDITYDLSVGGSGDIKNFFYVQDIYGEKVKTDRTLYFYKKSMEEFIKAKRDIKFINSTEGGASIEGAPADILKNVLENYGHKVKDRNVIENIIKDNTELMSKENVDLKMEKIKQNLTIVNEMCISAVEDYNSYIMANKDDIQERDFVAYNFNITNECIFSMMGSLKFLNILLSPAIINILGNPNFKEKQDMMEEDRIKIQLKRNIIFYNNIIESVKEFMKY